MDINFIQLLRDCYDDYNRTKSEYFKAYDYYIGNCDSIKNYKMITERSNNKCCVNYIKKFVKEEVSYSLGNTINYISKSDDKNIINSIDYQITSLWKSNHDIQLANKMILFGEAYEIYYLNSDGEFKSKIVDPRFGYVYEDELGNIILFMHMFKKQFDKTNRTYVDVYLKDRILHYDDTFSREISPETPHLFSEVPVGIARISDSGIYDTLYKDIQGLQDAYITNLSDISNEISDFRNAYLTITGVELTEDQAKLMKKNGILQIPNEDGKVNWLVKTINDSFIQNTLSTLEDKMYELTSHINHNVNLASNVSGVALRSRLIALEQRCSINQKAFENLLRKRLKLLFKLLVIRYGTQFDYKDVKIKFTPNIPVDDQANAQIISQLGDKLSLETALSLLSFVENPQNEIDKIRKDNEELINGSFLLGDDLHE